MASCCKFDKRAKLTQASVDSESHRNKRKHLSSKRFPKLDTFQRITLAKEKGAFLTEHKSNFYY